MSGYNNYNRPPPGQGGYDQGFGRGRYQGSPAARGGGGGGGNYNDYQNSGGNYGNNIQRQSSGDGYRREQSASYNRQPSHGAQASPGPARGSELPSKIYEIVGKVLLVQQNMDCGIIEVEGRANMKAFCFFLGKDVITNSKPGDRLTDKVHPGSIVQVNARLMDKYASVPFLASTVWSEGVEVGNEAVQKIMNPPDPQDERQYRKIAMDLSFQLKNVNKEEEDVRVIPSRSGHQDNRSRSRSPGGHRRRSRSPGSQRGSYPRGRSRSRSPERQKSYRRSPDERKRQRSNSRGRKDDIKEDTEAPKKMRQDAPSTPFVAPHTIWQAKEIETLKNSSQLVEEGDFKNGKAATIVKYNNEESGILSCGGEAKAVMFHVNQMWVFQSGIGWAHFRELYPTSELKAMFPPNSKLKCNIKRVDGGMVNFQATAVWLEGPPPPEYRTKEMMDDTQKLCSSAKYSTGYVYYLNNLQAGGLDSIPREGVVQEFLSLETGLIRLTDSDCSVVLFNLGQIWIQKGRGNYASSCLLKDDGRKILPQDYIPVGTKVVVTMRPIPAHKFSQLKYQAIYVCKQDRSGDRNLSQEFQTMYNSRQVRIELGRMLHEHHDSFKRLAQLSKIKTMPTNSDMNLVPIILNTLPVGGVALVVEADNGIMGHDMGLIKVAVPNSSQNLYALFHLEDVYNSEGVPAFQDTELTLDSIINKNVDLIARSICPLDNSRDILGMVRKVNERHPNAVIPMLQAVAVFVKNEMTGGFNPSQAPLPTYLRTDPKSFNSEQPGAAYYVNYLLKSELDRKVLEFMEYSPESITQVLPSVLNPYLSNPAAVPAIKSQIPARKVRLMKKEIDHIGATDLLYGSFDPTEHYPQENLPQIINALPCQIKLLHRNKWKAECGLIEFSIPDVEYKSVAFFHVGDVVTSKRTFGDLVKVMPANITEQVKLHAYLIDKDSKIPYIATAVWVDSEQSTDPPGVSNQDRSELWKTIGDEILLAWGDGVEDDPPVDDRRMMEDRRMMDDRKRVKEEQRPPRPAEPPRPWKWTTSLVAESGTVHKVLNEGYGVAVGYQRHGYEERRFYVLFDTCDVWLGDELANNLKKGLKKDNLMVAGDQVRFHAIHIENAENSWNLNYLATALISGKTRDAVDRGKMPEQAISVKSLSQLNADKVANFSKIEVLVCKKSPPEDPREKGRKEEAEKRAAREKEREKEEERRMEKEKSRKEDSDRRKERSRREEDERREKRRKDDSRKKESGKPSSSHSSSPSPAINLNLNRDEELDMMRVQRANRTVYDCKPCGIQSMNQDDAEGHLKDPRHAENRAKQMNAKDTSKDANIEEEMFQHKHKEITMNVENGRNLYFCEKCKVVRGMVFKQAQNHVVAYVHKKNHQHMFLENSQCEQEAKDMKMSGRERYQCTPCAFTNDFNAAKAHCATEDHKKRATNYCHVCKMFFKNKSEIQEHRFSIRHKKKLTENDKKPKAEEPEVKEEPKKEAKEEVEEKKESEKPKPSGTKQYHCNLCDVKCVESHFSSFSHRSILRDLGADEKDTEMGKVEIKSNLRCNRCDFDAKGVLDLKEHLKSDEHKKKTYLQTGELPQSKPAEDNRDAPRDAFDSFRDQRAPSRDPTPVDNDEEITGRLTTLKEMALIHEAKEMEEGSKKRGFLSIAKDKEDFLERKLIPGGVFQKMPSGENHYKCTTCIIKLSGKPGTSKKILSQLFGHFISDKHSSKLRVQVKAEVIAAPSNSERSGSEDPPRAGSQPPPSRSGSVAPVEETQMEAPVIPTVVIPKNQYLTDEEAAKMIEDVLNVYKPTPSLHMCIQCKTGLMTAKFMMRHVETEEHLAPPSHLSQQEQKKMEWRDLTNMNEVYQHGPDLFMCLHCGTGLMGSKFLQIHMCSKEHEIHADNCREPVNCFELNKPKDPITCDQCDRYFPDKQSHRCHTIGTKHAVQVAALEGRTVEDDDDELQADLDTLPASEDLPNLPPIATNRSGRILFLYETGFHGVIEFKQKIQDKEFTLHAMFDASRIDWRFATDVDRVLMVGEHLGAIVVPGYPVRFQAALINPKHKVDRHIQYYATTVQFGNVCRNNTQLKFADSFASLFKKSPMLVKTGVKDAVTEVRAQIKKKNNDERTDLFDEPEEDLRFESGKVISKNQSRIIVKIVGKESDYAIKTLEIQDIKVVESESEKANQEDTFEVGDEVSLNAILVNNRAQAQYLITDMWKSSDIVQAPLARVDVKQEAIDLFHAHLMNFDLEKLNDKASAAADNEDDDEDDNIANDDDDEDDNIADDDEEEESQPTTFTGFKLASFTNNEDSD